jgi:hypothetical protein
MPFTNFPGGVASFGVPLAGQGSLYDMPSGEVIFVCNRAGVVNGDGTQRDRPKVSIADALASITTTSGIATGAATIFVLSGHAENVTGSNIFSASLVNTTAVTIPAGTRIIGEGFGNARPTLTFTAAGSTLALAAANCSVENMILQCAQTGSTSTTVGVTVTAAQCMVRGCLFICAAGTASQFTTVISLSSAASQFFALDNFAWGVAGTGTPTAWLATTGTVGASQVVAQRNTILLPLLTTGAGCIDVSSASGTAPLNWIVTDNTLANLTTSSTVAIKGVAGWTGVVGYNNLGVGVTTNGTTTSINTPASTLSFQNFVTSGGKWAIVGGGTAAQTS